MPSRSMEARTCSVPGAMLKMFFVFRPRFIAWWTIEGERDMSSWELLVQEPIRPTVRSDGQPAEATSSLNSERGCAKSGVKGPLMCGSNLERLISKHSLS